MERPDRGEQYLYLTTRGRKSGLPREIEIWFTSRNGRYYVMAQYLSSHWVENVKAEPRVQVRVKTEVFAANARLVSADQEPDFDRAVRDIFREKYGWGEGSLVELVPEPDRT